MASGSADSEVLTRLQREPLGFDPGKLSVAHVLLPNQPFDSSEKRNIFYRQLADRVRALAGVKAVAAGTSRPLSSGAPMTVNVGREDSTNAPRISVQEITAEFSILSVFLFLPAGRLTRRTRLWAPRY
jgi:hypothetical protein